MMLSQNSAPWRIPVRMTRDSERHRAAFERFINQRGLKVQPWAEAAGVSESSVRNYREGRTDSMTYLNLDRLAKAAETTVAEMMGDRPAQLRPGRDVAVIQGLEVQAAMGAGINVSDEPAGEPFYFRKNFIEHISHGGVARLRVIECTGNSMEPTLNDRDVALVDLNSRNAASFPGVYCIWTTMGLAVKRVSAIPGPVPKFRVQSDNPLYGSDNINADDVQIVGRVVWRGGLI